MDIADIHAPETEVEPTIQQGETGEPQPMTPPQQQGDINKQPNPADVNKERTHSEYPYGNKVRHPTVNIGKRDPLTRSREEFPSLTATTDDDRETGRPQYVRKKKPRTEAETSEEKRGRKNYTKQETLHINDHTHTFHL